MEDKELQCLWKGLSDIGNPEYTRDQLDRMIQAKAKEAMRKIYPVRAVVGFGLVAVYLLYLSYKGGSDWSYVLNNILLLGVTAYRIVVWFMSSHGGEVGRSTREWLEERIETIRKTTRQQKENLYLSPILLFLAVGAFFGIHSELTHLEWLCTVDPYIDMGFVFLLFIPIIYIQSKEKKQQAEEVIRELKSLCAQIEN